MNDNVLDNLIAAARQARERAFAPYSRFPVGAALLTRAGDIVTGCNVESAVYGLTMCAERVAVFKAVSEGLHDFTHAAVVAATDALTPPCGACRQVLWEFGGDLTVVLANLAGTRRVLSLRELLPEPFDDRLLRNAGCDDGQ